MSLPRRRFLRIAAAATGAALAPRGAAAQEVTAADWSGLAFGAEASIVVTGGDPRRAAAAIESALAEMRAVEAAFSLHDPGSELARLNAAGRIHPSALFTALMDAADCAFRLTAGRFDPAVQTLWPGAGGAPDLVPWNSLVREGGSIMLAPGQRLTFNGIAQGFASDRVSAALLAAGYDRTLVDMGEIRAEGGPWRIGLGDPAAGVYGTRTLTGGALATSSPGLLWLGPTRSHIVNPQHPDAAPLWSSVTVEAATATLADALSTACCHMTAGEIAPLFAAESGLRAVTLVDDAGSLRTLRPA